MTAAAYSIRRGHDTTVLTLAFTECVHPDQVPLVQRLFTPPMKHVEHATRIVIANERAEEEGRGAFVVDGKMIDAPEVGKAHALLARAKQCRINIGAVRKIFENQIID